MKADKILKFFLNFLAIYLIGDGAIHLFNIRLQSVGNIWPQSALSYAVLLNSIYASFVFLVAILAFTAQKDLKKYKNLIFASSFWAIFHGLLLIYLITSYNFLNSFQAYASLYLGMSFYNQYLLFEAILAFFYASLVWTWVKSEK